MSVIFPNPRAAQVAPVRPVRRAIAAMGTLAFTAFLVLSPAWAQDRAVPRSFADLPPEIRARAAQYVQKRAEEEKAREVADKARRAAGLPPEKRDDEPEDDEDE